MEIPVRNTIFLQGVFFNEIKTLEEHILEENLNRTNKLDVDLKIPQCSVERVMKFKNKKQWSESYKDMTIKCWYCGLNFKGLPCFIPLQIRNTARGKEYDTHGLFCGFACAYAFLKNSAEFMRDRTYFDKLSMLKMLFIQFYNKRPLEFKEAPYIYDLTLYGGHVDIMEYRNNLKTINMDMINEAQAIHK